MPSIREWTEQIQAQVTRLVQASADAGFWRDTWVVQATQEHNQRLAKADRTYNDVIAESARVYDQQVATATQEYQGRVAIAEHEFRARMTQAQSDYQAVVPSLLSDAQSLAGKLGYPALPWQAAEWQVWRPTRDGSAPHVTRVGELVEGSSWDTLVMPALLPIIGGRPVLFSTTGAAKAAAVQVLQSVMFRLLATVSPGKLRFTFIDPVGLGQNVAGFMHLADYDEALVSGKAWTEPNHIEQRLAETTEHIENVIQKYLRTQFPTIEEYNEFAGEVAEPYRFLVIFDFPVNFSEAAARRLVSISQNGPRCGVFTLVLVDTAQPAPYGFNMADLERVSTVLRWNGPRCVWEGPDFGQCQLDLDAPPDKDVTELILKTVGEGSKEASRVEVPFARIAPRAEEWWAAESRDGLHIPLGPIGARKVQYLDLGKGTSQHALIAGKTGSGKSTLLHTLIASVALTYSPEEVQLYLIDFKKGVEFKTYATHQLPQARVIAIESEREFGLSVLQGLDIELKRRGDLFRRAGVDGLGDYRRKESTKLARILLLVDEFQEFFIEDDPIASQAAQILDRLVRQGRAFGIHVLLGSQTLAGAYTLARSTIDQMAIRIALQCSEADSRLILAEDNPAARLLVRPGEAIYNAMNGLVEGNNRFQVAWLPDDQRDQYLARVQALAEAKHYTPSQSQIIFEGDALGNIEKNAVLTDLLAAPQPVQPQRVVRAWLGEPIAIREPVAASFRAQSGSNLLILGQNTEAALGIMAASIVGVAAQLPRPPVTGDDLNDEPSIHVLDLGAMDGPEADYFTQMQAGLPGVVKVGRRRQLPDIIGKLATEVQHRVDVEPSSGSPIFLFIYALQRARDLRQDESLAFPSFGDEPAPASLAQQFTTILRDGPEVGVYSVVWCDTMTNLNRVLDRRTLREFAMRVAFQMSGEDSTNLIDTPAASKLGQFRALFYSEEEGRLEKIRPYAVPTSKWLHQAGMQLTADQMRGVTPRRQ